MAQKKDPTPRKTGIPVKGNIPRIVEWLITNCSSVEIEFMANLASESAKYKILLSIINRLIEYNITLVFHSKVHNAEELMLFREGKIGETDGLKAFAMACKVAYQEIEIREQEAKKGENE